MRLCATQFAVAFFLACGAHAVPAEGGGTIQSVPLSSTLPYFLPMHPRVTTTIRFPGPIGAPDGALSVFTEDAEKQPAEYLVTWQQGDSHFTVAQLQDARMANLNVPYQERTYVFYFYPVEDPLNAVAAVNLHDGTGAEGTPGSGTTRVDPTSRITKAAAPPPTSFVAATPARLIGFLDRLKLIHAMPPGPPLANLATTMGVQVAFSPEGRATTAGQPEAREDVSGATGEIVSGLNDAGLYQVLLLRAVRDSRLNCIGFICLIRNASEEVLTFDVNSFGARAGVEYFGQRVSDATATLKPGEQSPAYFVIQPSCNDPLIAANAWKITVDLVSPCPNPGASIGRKFAEDRLSR